MKDANPSDILGPQEVLDAQNSGRLAALAGNGAHTCPWKAPANDRERARRAMWIRGYAQGRTELRQAAAGHQDGHASPPA